MGDKSVLSLPIMKLITFLDEWQLLCSGKVTYSKPTSFFYNKLLRFRAIAPWTEDTLEVKLKRINKINGQGSWLNTE